ncbi:hypothetical protein [Congregibacter sp.]|jgi:hypothetical protein|uniref:hypothetical protein n=1 Tax=Congregibacter sp. TaxID=2744308 RepID=UPI0039E46EF8
MTFLSFLRTQLVMGLLTGVALGVVIFVALLFAGSVSGGFDIDVDLSSLDGLWALLLLPALLVALVLLVSPLSYGLLLLIRKWQS